MVNYDRNTIWDMNCLAFLIAVTAAQAMKLNSTVPTARSAQLPFHRPKAAEPSLFYLFGIMYAAVLPVSFLTARTWKQPDLFP